ncbi:MAG TPA: M48 family metalloprotease [Candidatus Sulfotelmatobacter sp.]|nr:M48 family metalloprotease [Candidatus Sulfotelmatobacter sp.]
MRSVVRLAAIAAVAVVLLPMRASFGDDFDLIRDAEIEHTIRTFVTPIFRAANLNPADVQIHLINDPQLNAFATNGQNIFINTGLLVRTTGPLQLIGVIAHESGHIAGGHLARSEDAYDNFFTENLIGLALGAAAALAAHNPGVASAAIFGSQQVVERSALAYSREQEARADQAAVTFMDRAGDSSRGLLEFLEVIGTEQNILVGQQDPYLVDHPITVERVDALRLRAERSPYYHANPPAAWVEMHARMRAKLIGFLQPLGAVLQAYPESDNSLPARYARAIAYYRIPDLGKALALINQLLAEHPNDPYFLELKGQMLFENGRIAESVPFYDAAVKAAPNEPLIRYELGEAQISTEDPKLYKIAENNLEEAARDDPDNPGVWYQLAIAYDRDGKAGMAALASAERALLIGQSADAKHFATRARGQLPNGSPGALRADDIISTADRRIAAQRNR